MLAFFCAQKTPRESQAPPGGFASACECVGVTRTTSPLSNHATPSPRTWSHVARLVCNHPEVKQVRLQSDVHGVAVGFYESPSAETLERIKAAVSQELSGQWDVSIDPDGTSPILHLHKIDARTTEVHRAHPANEPPVIWRPIRLPAWRNRSVPPIERDHRVMLVLAGVCGASTLTGCLLQRSGNGGVMSALCFTLAYLSGGWFAIQDVGHALTRGKVDIHFLMVAVALGALAVKSWTEGATLLFLFSLSNALEQFANHRTRRAIESLLKTAPKHALRREDNAWIEVPVEEVVTGDELLVKAGELFPVDAVVAEGSSSADESALTGEALPVAKQPGDSVSGGTLNLDGQCVIQTTRPLEESALSRIVSLIETAQQQKAPTQRFTDSFGRY
jgi:Cd2+/Zn2+-exporting ATPase